VPGLAEAVPAGPSAGTLDVGAPAGVFVPPRVRPARAEDAERVCRFLATPRMPATAWRPLFEHAWSAGWEGAAKGYLLVVGEERIVGFLAVTGAERRSGGRIARVWNLGIWSVIPDYRAWSLLLLQAATADLDATYTDLTAVPAVGRVLQRMGFQPLDREMRLMPPFASLSTLHRRGALVEADPVKVRALLGEADRRVFDDHAPYPCLQLALLAEGRVAHIVLKRRVKRRIPVSWLMRCGDPVLLTAHLERVKLAALVRQRTLALVADARLLGAARPVGIALARPVWFRSPTFTAADLDNLYSELVLLPI